MLPPFRDGQKQKKDELAKLIGAPGSVDEGSLTDEELAKRLDAYRQSNEFAPEFSHGKLARTVQERLAGNGISWKDAETISHAIANEVEQSGKLNPSWKKDYWKYLKDKTPSPGEDNAIRQQLDITAKEVGEGGYFLGKPDYSPDIKRVGDIIGTRQKKAANQKIADDFIASLPQELARGRSDFANSELGYGSQYYNESLAPSIVQNLNARGMVFSGDLESELNRGAYDVQSSIQNEVQSAQAQDDAFFQNAAYQNTFQKEIAAGNDVNQLAQNQRGMAMENQQQTFLRSQANLSQQYQSMIFQRENQRNMAIQQQQLARQRDMQQDQNRAGMFSGLGQSAGTIGGALIGNVLLPGIGGVIGAGLGGQFGQQGGQSLGGVTSR